MFCFHEKYTPLLALPSIVPRGREYKQARFGVLGLAEGGFAEFGDAAFVDHFAPAVFAAVAEADFVAGLDLGAGAHDGVGKLDEFAADAVAAFPAAEFELAVIFEGERGGIAGHGLAGNLGFGALVAAGEVDGLSVRDGETKQADCQSRGEPKDVSGIRDHKGWVGPHVVLRSLDTVPRNAVDRTG